MIVAVSDNLCIGKDNDLPWHLPTDLKRFKELTSNCVVIMGRKCYESIGRPLPKRINIVLSRDTKLTIPGCIIYNSLDEAIKDYKDNNIFIIGGSEIYKEGSKFADNFYITRVSTEVENGDTFLDSEIMKDWGMTEFDGNYVENGITFRFEKYIKIDGKETVK